ncbi:DUF3152 domain-containing protein [Streptomyces sp. NPDC008141]|uniref:DUF3152 domain-containing protein n=1 Tax=Streptomyces sp. NPDC008141 TaxID=3364815 RepID=UPI0036ECA5FA
MPRPLARRLVLPGAALAVLVIASGAAVAHWGAAPGTPRAAAAPAAPPGSPALVPDPQADESDASPPGRERRSPSAEAGSPSDPKPRATPSTEVPKPAKPSRKAAPPPAVPASGPGTFATARSAGSPVGAGQVRRYRVQVENGIAVSAEEAATEIERILAHPQGWAANGKGTFQRVTGDADFVIRIATPATADALCRRQGLNTRGELNCETTDGVVVNLRRWMLGSPTFAGTPAEYRHLIINHEVGHEIGLRTHMGCPGPGEPAPVMMQQIKGLDGCRSNAWPYDEDGTYLTGPVID